MKAAESKLFEFIDRLRAEKIAFSLTSVREGAIMVQIAVPGERWEVEFFANGDVEVEKFRSSGEITGETTMKELFERFAD